MDTDFDYAKTVPNVMQALSRVHGEMAKVSLDGRLQHLVSLRASQINGCAYCVKLHTSDARRDGESSERLDRLIVWRHVDDFTPTEKSAFAWTEALTQLDANTDFASLRAGLQEHFSSEQIGVLTSLIAMINLWNRIQISVH